MWTICNWICYNIDSVLFIFFWPWDMWDPSSLTRDWPCTPCIGRWSLNHWTAREVAVLIFKKLLFLFYNLKYIIFFNGSPITKYLMWLLVSGLTFKKLGRHHFTNMEKAKETYESNKSSQICRGNKVTGQTVDPNWGDQQWRRRVSTFRSRHPWAPWRNLSCKWPAAGGLSADKSEMRPALWRPRSCVLLLRAQPRSHSEYQEKEESSCGASLVAQWWRIRLPMQEMQVQSLVREDPTCCRATEPLSHKHRARALQALKPECPRACALQQEKPQQWEARAPRPESRPLSLQLEKSLHSNEDPAQSKIKINK